MSPFASREIVAECGTLGIHGASFAVGEGIFQRLAARELGRAQGHVLDQLSRIPASRYLTLCGPAALHGVFLHRRRTRSLDFYASPLIAFRFAEMARRAGLELEEADDGSELKYVTSGQIFSQVQVAIRLIPRANIPIVQEGAFLGAIGQRISVRVLTLSELLVQTFYSLQQHPTALGAVDLWLALREYPDLRCQLSSATKLHRSAYLAALAPLENTWHESLQMELFPVPPFAQVRSELALWLPASES